MSEDSKTTTNSDSCGHTPIDTNPNAATSDYTIGTEFQSTDGGMRGRLRLYRTCSIHDRRYTTRDLLCEETSHTADNGCAGRMCPDLSQHRGQE